MVKLNTGLKLAASFDLPQTETDRSARGLKTRFAGCSTLRSARIRFAPLENTHLCFRYSDHCASERAGSWCVGPAGGQYCQSRFQAMGTARDSGWRASQTGGHVCEGNADPGDWKIGIHRPSRPEMAAERFCSVGAARD